ncbi:TPA: DUF1310 family protein [Streptococcus suis]|nr:DUF1310 family protein [Streptococcus suis]HEM3658018.1 DUF1310 family protein [Streptococcus suis]HEM3668493.1 DUF1310 family protein [Streptococcus suis]HEM3722637.1 DUF1310 family protein [Streptococcus suis]
MKTVVKILVGVIAAIALGIGGFKLMQKIEHDQMVEIVKSEEVRGIIEDDLLEMDKTALTETGLIKSYKIDEESIRHNPMGGISFKIYINDDDELYVFYTVTRDSGTRELVHSGGGNSAKFEGLITGGTYD